MKSFILTTLIIIKAILPAFTQSPLLNAYYDMKNALVSSNPTSVASHATAFMKAGKMIDPKTLTGEKFIAFTALQKDLAADAARIEATKDLSLQRHYFANLSNNFYSLLKLVKLSDQPVYRDYCPMKKAYWLSSDKNIQNPYYGSMMLTCGNITETIIP